MNAPPIALIEPPPPGVIPNRQPKYCASCDAYVPAFAGEYKKNPLRLLCPACAIVDHDVHDLEGRLLELQTKGNREGNKLRGFQLEDVRRIAPARAKLLTHQMGCGKTVIASVACLRSDMPNLLFTPASVKRNWQREIQNWRPDLNVELIQRRGRFRLPENPGDVLIGTYGMIPGGPCLGCADLIRRLRKAKKAKAYHGMIPDPIMCMHVGPETPHPPLFPLDSRTLVPYHEGCKGGERGCWQDNPTPEIPGPLVLMADEAHALKTASALRTKRWRTLRERAWLAGGRVYGLTGTPCEGKPNEYWEVLRSFGLERASFGTWGVFYMLFRDWFDNEKGFRRPPQGEARREVLYRLRRVQVTRRRKDVLKQLPPRILQTIELDIDAKTMAAVNEATHRMLAVRRAWNEVVEGRHFLRNPYERGLDPEEKARRRKLYDERVEHYFVERPWKVDEEMAIAVEAALNSKGRTPTIDELARIRAMLSLAKAAAVEEWVSDREEEGEPIVLFSQHVSIVKRFGDARPGWASYHGGVSEKRRDAIVKAFQAGEIENLAVSIQAGGEGITLTKARVAGFVDLNWNPAKNQQSESRLIRIGAEKHDSIVIVRFVARHAVDRLVVKTVDEKELLLTALEDELDFERE